MWEAVAASAAKGAAGKLLGGGAPDGPDISSAWGDFSGWHVSTGGGCNGLCPWIVAAGLILAAVLLKRAR